MTKNSHILLLSALLFASACSGNGEQDAGNQEVVKSVNVETEVISPQSFESYIQVVGNVFTPDDIMISSEISGRVIKHFVEVGDKVQKGDTILKIDDTRLLQEKKRLEAVTELSRTNYERLQRLYEEEGIGSEMEYLNAKYALEQNQSALQGVKVDLDNTTILAPFDAKVEDLLLDEGEMASPGMQIVRLIGSGRYKVSAGVPARYADVIQARDKVKIWFDSQSPDTITTTISFAGKSINPQNRTFRIEVNLPRKENAYKVDMIANMQLSTLAKDSVIVVSEEFLYRENENYVVYVTAEDESGDAIAEKRNVVLGPVFKSDVIVRDGLNFGETMITVGSAFLTDGMRLNIVENANSTALN